MIGVGAMGTTYGGAHQNTPFCVSVLLAIVCLALSGCIQVVSLVVAIVVVAILLVLVFATTLSTTPTLAPLSLPSSTSCCKGL